VAIADDKIADVIVATSRQLLLNAKKIGTTSLVVWSKGNRYQSYEVVVHSGTGFNQVVLNVKVAEVNRARLKELGFDFFLNARLTEPGRGCFDRRGLRQLGQPRRYFLVIFNHVNLIHKHEHCRNVYLVSKKDVFACLRHRAIISSNRRCRGRGGCSLRYVRTFSRPAFAAGVRA
jgi:hypothetical protein